MRNEQFMLFQTQKKKIQQYLKTLTGDMSAFDELLNDYVNGDFKACFISLGVTDIKIHIDWHDNYKCIELHGKYLKNYVDLQIEQTEFGIAIDPIEPDIEESIPLESKKYCIQYVRKNFQKYNTLQTFKIRPNRADFCLICSNKQKQANFFIN